MKLAALGLVALLACGGNAAPTQPQPPPQQPKQSQQPKQPAGNVWRAGIGFDGCAIGDALATCEQRFGPAQRQDGYALFPAAGVELAVADGRVVAVFAKYQSKAGAGFTGTDPDGIGATSSIADVHAAYGEPSRIGDSEVSQYGEFPGAQDHTMEYDARGVSFTFLDGKLGHVAISAPRPR